jgi:hypothetical protein
MDGWTKNSQLFEITKLLPRRTKKKLEKYLQNEESHLLDQLIIRDTHLNRWGTSVVWKQPECITAGKQSQLGNIIKL